METTGLMVVLLLLLGCICIGSVRYVPQKPYFFNTKDSIALRGVFCLVIVLVHVPQAYQNMIQDMMGSFAYIGVTYFFMVSSYGLKYGYNKKENYLKSFWSNGGPRLLIPMFIVNLIVFLVRVVLGRRGVSVWLLLHVDEWVGLLLLFYFVFWLLYCIPIKKIVLVGVYMII